MRGTNILVLSPDPADQMYNGRWRDILEQLTTSLQHFGIEVSHAAWTRDLRMVPHRPQLVLPLLAWGYQRAHEQWLDTCKDWQRHQIPVHNPPDVLQWNSDKSYLKTLAEKGAPVVPSLYFDEISTSRLRESLSYFDVDRVVLKPTVSATAYKTSIWEAGQLISDPPEGSCIVQPYLRSIETEGEISLIFISGQYSHGLRKTPVAGDFRVQPEFGGRLTHHEPDQSAISTATKILETIGTSLLYARIDLVLNQNNEWALLEAELIEPDLFLGLDHKNGHMLGEAILNRINGQDIEQEKQMT
ncbi:hypothetical protein QA648_27725 (plasmid) [Rhizobium sp. CB3171]|uniref:ATP-grasp domain-containing protein n=1 Tax=Rhizobium sp. CB3171 TaxID=3039157 RepID=UPI0024B0B5C6|nr:hypothetical protein [Rhizobium sp. CB3171]WFU04569.1 hypothetical protein QA648_27725 [Rhizobium sp. CB3171]